MKNDKSKFSTHNSKYIDILSMKFIKEINFEFENQFILFKLKKLIWESIDL